MHVILQEEVSGKQRAAKRGSWLAVGGSQPATFTSKPYPHGHSRQGVHGFQGGTEMKYSDR